MTLYHFYPCPLLSCAHLNILNRHFLDTCCFNNLDYMVFLLGIGEFLPVYLCIEFVQIIKMILFIFFFFNSRYHMLFFFLKKETKQNIFSY